MNRPTRRQIGRYGCKNEEDMFFEDLANYTEDQIVQAPNGDCYTKADLLQHFRRQEDQGTRFTYPNDRSVVPVDILREVGAPGFEPPQPAPAEPETIVGQPIGNLARQHLLIALDRHRRYGDALLLPNDRQAMQRLVNTAVFAEEDDDNFVTMAMQINHALPNVLQEIVQENLGNWEAEQRDLMGREDMTDQEQADRAMQRVRRQREGFEMGFEDHESRERESQHLNMQHMGAEDRATQAREERDRRAIEAQERLSAFTPNIPAARWQLGRQYAQTGEDTREYERGMLTFDQNFGPQGSGLRGGDVGSPLDLPPSYEASRPGNAPGRVKKRITLQAGLGPGLPIKDQQGHITTPEEIKRGEVLEEIIDDLARLKKGVVKKREDGPKKASKTKGQKKEATLLEELIKRASDPKYGKDVPDIQAGQKLKGEEKWGEKKKDKGAELKEELKKSAQRQNKRMDDIISKYEKQATAKKAPAKKAPAKKASTKDLKKILDDSAGDTVDFAKKLKSMMPGKAKKKSKACDLRGYSKLKKADLISSISSVTSHSEADLKSLTVKKLRAIAHEHCGYKKRGSTGNV